MAAARHVRDSDTALWLHNKLGSSDELWISPSIGTILKTNTIDNIYRCFQVLTTNVKMKLLLGILHLPRRNLEEMKHTIEGLIELALNDTDQWVRLIANILKPYPMTCKLSLDLRSNEIALNILKKLEEKVRDTDTFATLPIECQYVNKNALHSLVGNQPPPTRHFALKRKPKSATLRAELLQKSNDAVSQGRGSGGLSGSATVPVKHRDMTRKFSDSSPMRGIPSLSSVQKHDNFTRPSSQNVSSLSSQSRSRYSGRQERSTKLLDISEQPIASRESKRRKKQQDQEHPAQPDNEATIATETPDYAAKLPSASLQETATDDLTEEHSQEPEQEDKLEEKEDSEDDDEKMDTETDQMEDSNPLSSPNTSYAPEINYSSMSQSSAMEAMPATPVPVPVATNRRRNSPPPPDPPRFNKHQDMKEDEPVQYAMPATPSPFFHSQKSREEPAHLMTPPVSYGINRQMSAPRHIHELVKHKEPAVLEMPPTPKIISHEPQYLPREQNTNQRGLPQSNVPHQPHGIHATVTHVAPNNQQQLKPLDKPTQATVISFSSPQRLQIPGTQPQIFSPTAHMTSAGVQQRFQHNTQTMPRYPASVFQQSLHMPVVQRPMYMVNPQQLQQLRQQQLQLQQQQQTSVQAQAAIRTASPRFVQQSRVPLSQSYQANATLLQQQQASLLQQQQRIQEQQRLQQQSQPNLKLTQTQMFEAQEMFRTANRLKRADKSIIIGFMAGSRDNPFPEKGDVLQIVLSEHEQNIQNPQGSGVIPVTVETLYEINYRTGTSAKRQRFKATKPT